jgi:hypothetical protein
MNFAPTNGLHMRVTERLPAVQGREQPAVQAVAAEV